MQEGNIELDATTYDDNETPVMVAAHNSHLEIVQILLDTSEVNINDMRWK
jgi:Ankyrin repeat